MLPYKKEKMDKMKEGTPYCARCNKEMKEVILAKYEYEEGCPLEQVPAYRCLECGNIFFTETQAKSMKSRTLEVKQIQFGFERKVTISGKSLVVTIPYELAEHLHLKQGSKVKLFPVIKEGFVVRKV